MFSYFWLFPTATVHAKCTVHHRRHCYSSATSWQTFSGWTGTSLLVSFLQSIILFNFLWRASSAQRPPPLWWSVLLFNNYRAFWTVLLPIIAKHSEHFCFLAAALSSKHFFFLTTVVSFNICFSTAVVSLEHFFIFGYCHFLWLLLLYGSHGVLWAFFVFPITVMSFVHFCSLAAVGSSDHF